MSLSNALSNAMSGIAAATRGTEVVSSNLANALTVFRLLLVPVFLFALFRNSGHSAGWRVSAWAIFALASVTDRFDGELARLQAEGVPITMPLTEEEWGERAFQVRDPNGVIIQLVDWSAPST